MTVTRLQQTKADAQLNRERLVATKISDLPQPVTLESLFDWLKSELALNAYPLVEALTDAVQEDVVRDVAELAQELDALAEDSEFLHEETIGQILTVFDQGKVLCQLLEAATKAGDQTTRKRAQNAIRTYRAQESAVRDVVMAIPTLEADGEPDDGGDGGDDDPGLEPEAPADPALVPDAGDAPGQEG